MENPWHINGGFNVKIPILMGKSHILMGKSPILMGKSQF
jgi:hypothetical protein